MKLYTHHGACSSASHIALIEAGLDFELITLNIMEDRTLPDGRHYNEVNPKGYVPLLELDNGESLTENVAILQYIADQVPQSGLAPANGTMERYRLQEWLGYLNSEIHKGFSPLFTPNTPEEVKQSAREKLNGRFQYIEDALEGMDYLMDTQFTIIDAYLYIILGWAAMVDVDLTPFTNIKAYQQRIANRESVKNYLTVLGS